MIVYVPVGTGPTRDRIVGLGHGYIMAPDSFRTPPHRQRLPVRWIFDNGAYSNFIRGKPFDFDLWWHLIFRICFQFQPSYWPEAMVLPDIVAGGKRSLEMSQFISDWAPFPFKWWLVVQDGMTPRQVRRRIHGPFWRCEGIFVGGSTEWKLKEACRWVDFAKEEGLWSHIGRINGPRRLQWAVNLGADSVDGTGWVKDPRWIEYLKPPFLPEPMLFEVNHGKRTRTKAHASTRAPKRARET